MVALRARYEQANTTRKRRIALASILVTLASLGIAAKLMHDASDRSAAAAAPASITTITSVTVPGPTATTPASRSSK